MAGAALFFAGLHWIAYAVLSPFFEAGAQLDQRTLAILSVTGLLSLTMLLSQAMESVTRGFYARDDLDLILSSPAPASDLFVVRIGMMALTGWLMSLWLIAPFLNVAAILGGAFWLSGYLVILSLSLLGTSGAVLITLALFRALGAARTRMSAQIVAAIVGAAFLIGLQIVAIMTHGSLSRMSLFDPAFLASNAPRPSSGWWFLAHAAGGNLLDLAALLSVSILVFALAAWIGASEFRRVVTEALGTPERVRRQRQRPAFRALSTDGALIRKEALLMARDPWLISQSLMQILYLVPPALMLWMSFGENSGIAIIIAPVVVMAIGQLSGGLAWLTICGEDAPDLLATAPITPRARLAAKAKAVLFIAGAIAAPMALGLALVSPLGALVTLTGALAAASCAILIQLWFRAQASRTQFRRRQVASKAATFAEAGASICCAGASALLAAGSILALLPLLMLGVIMGAAWAASPKKAS